LASASAHTRICMQRRRLVLIQQSRHTRVRSGDVDRILNVNEIATLNPDAFPRAQKRLPPRGPVAAGSALRFRRAPPPPGSRAQPSCSESPSALTAINERRDEVRVAADGQSEALGNQVHDGTCRAHTCRHKSGWALNMKRTAEQQSQHERLLGIQIKESICNGSGLLGRSAAGVFCPTTRGAPKLCGVYRLLRPHPPM